MIKITDVVDKIVRESDIAFSALQAGILNMSAYASKIRPEVEERAKKPVREGTIVVALSRLSMRLQKEKTLVPHIKIEDIAVKSGLVEIVFDKAKDNADRLKTLYNIYTRPC